MKRAFLLLFCLSVLLSTRSSVQAQYIYVDTNGDGLNSAADVMNPVGVPTTVAVYLNTNHDADGSLQSCNSHTGPPSGSPLDLGGYDLILRAGPGTVIWGTWIDDLGFGVLGTDQSNSKDLRVSRVASGANKTPGLWKLGHVMVTAASRTSLVRITTATSLAADAITGFATSCDASANPNTYTLGIDWFDVGVAGAVESWQEDGVPIVTVSGSKNNPTIAADGSGGGVIVWEDPGSPTSGQDIYAERIDATGADLWDVQGIPICSVTGHQSNPTLAPDGAGGFLFAWTDPRSGNGDIYAQRVSANGTPTWALGGVAVCTATGDQIKPKLVADGSGGMIVTWYDARAGQWDIYAQHLTPSGTVASGWAMNGVALCTQTSHQLDPRIISDGSGGAIVTWQDLRVDRDIYAQHVTSAGGIASGWPTNGLPICTASNEQSSPELVADGTGGAIITWFDGRGSQPYDIYAQKVRGDGTIPAGWVTNGNAVCDTTSTQLNPKITSDLAGGAIIAWEDYRAGIESDIYAGRIASDGSRPSGWAKNGVALVTFAGDQLRAEIATDEAGGAVVTWEDRYAGIEDTDIFVQRLNAFGQALWAVDGVSACAASGNQIYPKVASDATGGAIITWGDYRQSASNSDVYAMRVAPGGGKYLTGVDGAASLGRDELFQNYPNPCNPGTTIAFRLGHSSLISLRIYDVQGRLVETLVDSRLGAGPHRTFWSGRGSQGKPVASGIYFSRLTTEHSAFTRRMVVLK